MLSRLLSLFFRGLLLVAPIAITGYVLVSSLRFVDEIFNIETPGIGLLVLLAGITVIGALSQTFLVDPLIHQFERLIKKVPLAALIYSSVKDLLSAFVGDKKKFEQPVLVEILPNSGIQKIGFITQSSLNQIFGQDNVAVYFPHSYNISGEVMIVKGDRVKLLNWKSSEAMKFVVSGGVAYHLNNNN